MSAATLTVPEAAEMLGVSTWSAYERIKAEEFPVPVLRLGRTIRIPRAPLLALLGLDAGASHAEGGPGRSGSPDPPPPHLKPVS